MRKTLFVALLFAAYCAKAHQQKPTTLTTNHTNKTITTPSCKTQKLYVVASNKGSISLWDANTGHMKANMVVPNGLTVQEVQYNETENYVVVVCYKTLNDAQLFMWKPETDEKKFITLSKTKKVKDIRIGEDNATLFVLYNNNSLEYIELSTQKKLLSISPIAGTVNINNILLNKNLILLPTDNGELYIYNTDSQEQVKKLSGIEAQKITFSPNGKALLISTETKVKIYDTKTWQLTTEKDAAILERADTRSTSYYKH